MGLVGCFVSGNFQDHFGRKKNILLITGVYCVACIASAFINNFYGFVICRLLAHATQLASFSSAYMYALECTGPSKRTVIGAVFCAGYAAGAVLLAVVAYAFTDLRSFILASVLPFLVLILCYPILLESPRWLFSVGRNEEAIALIARFAKYNGRSVTRKDVEVSLAQQEEMKGESNDSKLEKVRQQSHESRFEIGKLFIFPKFRTVLFITTFGVITIHITYMTIAYNVTNIGGNFFVTYGLQAFVEFPAVLINIPVISYFGRIWPLVISMLGSSICSVLSAIIREVDFLMTSVGLVVFSKFLICMAYGIIYQLAAEVYPTEVRGLAFGFTTLLSGAFTISMPYIVSSAGAYRVLPMLILGLLCSVGGISMLCLPETKFRPMLELLGQVEKDVPVGRPAWRENMEYAKNGLRKLFKKPANT